MKLGGGEDGGREDGGGREEGMRIRTEHGEKMKTCERGEVLRERRETVTDGWNLHAICAETWN